jgi:hypothetical protein
MSVPLDNLYHWIQRLAQHPVTLYVFHPHGSKDIFNLDQFENTEVPYWPDMIGNIIICHDQEPLNFDSHQFDYDFDRLERLLLHRGWTESNLKMEMNFYKNLSEFPDYKATWLNAGLKNDYTVLLHSEQNSKDVDKFSQERFLPVYYWCHAVVARDWYRFAEHDVRLNSRRKENSFLIYCRDWTPTREYRLKFLDLLVSNELVNDCVISTQHTNKHGVHLHDYQIQDPRFLVDTQRLLCIPENYSPPTASADYDVKDITSTSVSIVLETVVDGPKIHLTEKILRPIACSHPFVLMAGPGALAYLKSYGFQTFGEVWDETYDQETDTVKRMEMIIKTMQQIQTLTDSDWKKINEIAEYNKRHFFSKEFMNQVTEELQINLNHVLDFCSKNRGKTFWNLRKFVRRLRLVDSLTRGQYSFKDNISKNSLQELRRIRSRRFHNNP